MADTNSGINRRRWQTLAVVYSVHWKMIDISIVIQRRSWQTQALEYKGEDGRHKH